MTNVLHALLVTIIGGSILSALFFARSGKRDLARARRSKGFATFFVVYCLVLFTCGAFLVGAFLIHFMAFQGVFQHRFQCEQTAG